MYVLEDEKTLDIREPYKRRHDSQGHVYSGNLALLGYYLLISWFLGFWPSSRQRDCRDPMIPY